jgi:sugar-specific transcriptional regulator TrmB
MLESLGVAPDVETVYRALLGRPGTTIADLAGLLALPPLSIEEALTTLVDSGLVIRSDEDGFAAAPPAIALGALIADRRDGLRLAEQALATFAEEHRAAVAGQNIGDLIEVITGVDAIRHRYQQVQQAATTELRMFVTSPFVAVRPGENAAEPAAASRGVRIRVVVEQAVLAEPGAIGEAVESLRRGLEVRVVDHLPMKLVLADADLALVPLGVAPPGEATDEPGIEPGAVLLQRSGLLAALDALFENVWRRAHRLDLAGLDASDPVDSEADAPTALDRQIISLLLAGMTDQAVCAQLDLSLRTLQRRLRHLQDLAGVQSRMQLGWYAAKHDWS